MFRGVIGSFTAVAFNGAQMLVVMVTVFFGVMGVLVASPLVAIVNILHDELFRKRFLPTVTDADLDNMARKALRRNTIRPTLGV